MNKLVYPAAHTKMLVVLISWSGVPQIVPILFCVANSPWTKESGRL